MDLYIDKENLTSFIHSKDKEEFDDCKRMLKRQLHIFYNMTKDALKGDTELLHWINGLGEGRGNSEETDTFLETDNQKFPVRPIKSNTCNTWDWEKLTSVYLISDEDCRKLKDCGCVLIGDKGEELEILSRLFCGRDYDYHHLYDLQKNFHSWNQLVDDNQMLPTTDIIINDRYLFSKREGWTEEQSYELVKYNLRGMLNALANNVNKRINIVIYTIKKGLDEFGSEKATKIVKKSLINITGVKPNVTFITSNDNKLIPHDRFVITNYRLLRSGDSFIYFKTNGELSTKGSSLDVDSLANHEVYTFVESLLGKLQDTYNEVQKRNSDMIIGDKESNFIKMKKH